VPRKSFRRGEAVTLSPKGLERSTGIATATRRIWVTYETAPKVSVDADNLGISAYVLGNAGGHQDAIDFLGGFD